MPMTRTAAPALTLSGSPTRRVSSLGVTGTFTQYPGLIATLPPLIKTQRRLAARIAAVAQDVKDEKAIRQDIDRLLVAAGLTKGDVVTCAGYDVRHNEKDGAESLNPLKVTEQLAAAGVALELIAHVLMDSTETGNPSAFTTVTPSKGAVVKPPQTLQIAKTSRKRA
jgi:hypothetical protein